MRISRRAATAGVLTMALSACSGTPTAPQSPRPSSAKDIPTSFPVTIEHSHGTTVIESKPERVATAASWANHDVPLALGVVPVGMSKATWGDDDKNGVLPWVEDKLKKLDAPTPVLFDETDGIPFETVADTRPDVILAPLSGITKEQYDRLSRIAPVVAHPGKPWGTSYQQMIRLSAAALGLGAEAEKLIGELETQVKRSLAKHSKLVGKKLLFSSFDPADLSTFGYYTAHDTRPRFFTDLNMPMPNVVAASAKSNEFYLQVSSEDAARFADIDVLITYGDAGSTIVKALQADPLLSKIPAIASGSIAILVSDTPLAASASPTPLSIPWSIDKYLALLENAVK